MTPRFRPSGAQRGAQCLSARPFVSVWAVGFVALLALLVACGSPAAPAECVETPKDTPLVAGTDTVWVRTYYCEGGR